eukprot:3023210-Prymnesium_polylepis.1
MRTHFSTAQLGKCTGRRHTLHDSREKSRRWPMRANGAGRDSCGRYPACRGMDESHLNGRIAPSVREHASSLINRAKEALHVIAEPPIDTGDEEVGEEYVNNGIRRNFETLALGVGLYELGHRLESLLMTLPSLESISVYELAVAHPSERVAGETQHTDVLVDSHRILILRQRSEPDHRHEATPEHDTGGRALTCGGATCGTLGDPRE